MIRRHYLFAFASTIVCFFFASTSEAENPESILVVLLLSALFASFTTQSIKSPLKSGRSRRFRERSALKITQIQNTKIFYTNITTQLGHLKSVWFPWNSFFKSFDGTDCERSEMKVTIEFSTCSFLSPLLRSSCRAVKNKSSLLQLQTLSPCLELLFV